MAKLFKQRYSVPIYLLVLGFILGIYIINQNVSSKLNKISYQIISGNYNGYNWYVKNSFNTYVDCLHTWAQLYERKQGGHGGVPNCNNRNDSAIVMRYIIDKNVLKKIDTNSVDQLLDFDLPSNTMLQMSTTDFLGTHYLLFNYYHTPTNTSYGCVIDLYRIHEQFIVDDVYTNLFQIIITNQGYCVYHPNKKKIGVQYTKVLENNDKFESIPNTKDLFKGYSDYLGIEVYKGVSTLNIGKEEWTTISVVPGFEMGELLKLQERSIISLSVTFVSILLLLLFLAFLDWRKGHFKHLEIVKENSLLKLVNEREKRDKLNAILVNERNKQEIVEGKLALIKTGLNSHFLFNSLATVRALLNDKNKIGKQAISDLATLYRYQLKIEGKTVVTLKQELEFTRTYLNIINLRTQESVKLDLNGIDGDSGWQILPVSLQVLVQNCVKHNVASEDYPLTVKIYKAGNYCIVENEMRPKLMQIESNKVGLKNLVLRYSFISKQPCLFSVEGNKYVAKIPLIEKA